VGITRWIGNGIPYENRGYLRNFAQIPVDGRALVFAFLTALAAGVIFGLAPAMEGSRLDLNGVLKEGAGRGSPSRRGRLLRDGLVAAEIALATVLLVSNILMVRSLTKIWSLDTGFRPNGVLSVSVNLPPKAYQDLPRAERTLETILARVRTLPGVDAASAADSLPFGNHSDGRAFWIVGQTDPPPGDVPSARFTGATPGHFDTLGISLLAGRDFTAADDAHSPRVVVINDVFAQRHWPNQSPLGRYIRIGGGRGLGKNDAEPAEIVGVVKSVKMYLDDLPERQMYVPMSQHPVRATQIAVRTGNSGNAPGGVPGDAAGGAAGRLQASLREAVWSVDRNTPVPEMKSMNQAIEETYTPHRLTTQMISGFAVLTLVLAATGLYAMMAWSVTQRSREIGIRMALGARGRDIVATVLRRGVVLTTLGAVAGLCGAAAAARSLTIILYNVSPYDPATYATVAGVLVLVALMACYLPARRASKLEPASALRHD
jgi:putative ABC transport system permease protein